MIKRFLLLCWMLFFLASCIQVGNVFIPVGGSSGSSSKARQYAHPAKTHFSDSDLDSYRKSGSYYNSINTKRNSNLPKAKPYTVLGKTYVPYASAAGFEEIGIASWYGPGFHGKKTSNGEVFNTYALTAAHKYLPFDTNILVTNLENGKNCVVRITDRGPFVDDRIIDLSQAAAKQIDMIKNGTAKVHLTYLDNKGKNSSVHGKKNSSGGFLDMLFGNNSSKGKKTSEEDQSVSAALSALTGGSLAAGNAGYTNNQSMAEVKPVYVNTAKADTKSSVQSLVSKIYLHLAVYDKQNVANNLVQELKKRNIPAAVFKDNGFYSVHAGPFKNKDLATQVQQYLKKNFPQSYLVVR